MTGPLRMLYNSKFPLKFFGLSSLGFVYSIKHKDQDFYVEADFYDSYTYLH